MNGRLGQRSRRRRHRHGGQGRIAARRRLLITLSRAVDLGHPQTITSMRPLHIHSMCIILMQLKKVGRKEGHIMVILVRRAQRKVAITRGILEMPGKVPLIMVILAKKVQIKARLIPDVLLMLGKVLLTMDIPVTMEEKVRLTTAIPVTREEGKATIKVTTKVLLTVGIKVKREEGKLIIKVRQRLLGVPHLQGKESPQDSKVHGARNLLSIKGGRQCHILTSGQEAGQPPRVTKRHRDIGLQLTGRIRLQRPGRASNRTRENVHT